MRDHSENIVNQSPGPLLIGESHPIDILKKQIEKARKSFGHVIITGETGTGKELVAKQLRPTLSDGSLSPFLAVDSSTIQSSTAESFLFGHEKGAFTGALARKLGRFEIANRGTIFLDEVGELPLETQAKLLRVFQEGEFERVGGTHTN